jgi:hypothetical protein
MASIVADSNVLSIIIFALKTTEELMDFARINNLMNDIRVRNRLTQLEAGVSDFICLLFIDCVMFCLFHIPMARYDSISYLSVAIPPLIPPPIPTYL